MKGHAFEILATLFAITLMSAAHFYQEGANGLLLLSMFAGTAAGAVIGVFGGKRLEVFDTGANGILAKCAAHFAVSVIYGPLSVQWAVQKWPDVEPMSMAAATGGTVALFGTNILVMTAPFIAKVANAVLTLASWKLTPSPPPSPQSPPSPADPLSQFPPKP